MRTDVKNIGITMMTSFLESDMLEKFGFKKKKDRYDLDFSSEESSETFKAHYKKYLTELEAKSKGNDLQNNEEIIKLEFVMLLIAMVNSAQNPSITMEKALIYANSLRKMLHITELKKHFAKFSISKNKGLKKIEVEGLNNSEWLNEVEEITASNVFVSNKEQKSSVIGNILI